MNGEYVYPLNEVQLGDEVFVRNGENSKTVLAGTVKAVNTDLPQSIELEGIPFKLELATPEQDGWRIINLSRTPDLPVDPGMYLDANGHLMELHADGTWSPPLGRGSEFIEPRPGTEFTKIAPVAQTAASVLDAVVDKLGHGNVSDEAMVNVHGAVVDVRAQFGVEPPAELES